MAEDLLGLELEESAEIAYTSLKPEDQRQVAAWFDHLRKWRKDEFVRSKSRRLTAEEETYVLQTSTDLLIVFEIAGDKVIVLAIYRQGALRAFEATAGRSGE